MEFNWPKEDRSHPACPDSRPVVRARAQPLFPPLARRESPREQLQRIQKEAAFQQDPADPYEPLKDHEVRYLKRHCELKYLKENLNSKVPEKLPFLLGRNIWTRDPWTVDLGEASSLLLVGAAATGKTQLVECGLRMLAKARAPEVVQFVIFTPGRGSADQYDGLAMTPHMVVPPATTGREVAERMEWLLAEARLRREWLLEARLQAKNGLEEAKLPHGSLLNKPQPLPRLVVVVDGLDGLNGLDGKAQQHALERISRTARQTRIHLILMAQSVRNYPTPGLLRNANHTVAFQMPSYEVQAMPEHLAGAEKLARRGEFLYRKGGEAPIRGWGVHDNPAARTLETRSLLEVDLGTDKLYWEKFPQICQIDGPLRVSQMKEGTNHEAEG